MASDEARKSRKKKKKRLAMREKFGNTASSGILGNHREVLCVSCDVYEADVCRANIIIILSSRLETFTMLQV